MRLGCCVSTAARAGTFRQQLRQSRRAHRTPTSTTGRAETAAGARHVRRLGEVRRRGASARGVGRGSAPRRAAAASPLACHADPTPTAGAGRIFGDTTKGRFHTGPGTWRGRYVLVADSTMPLPPRIKVSVSNPSVALASWSSSVWFKCRHSRSTGMGKSSVHLISAATFLVTFPVRCACTAPTS